MTGRGLTINDWRHGQDNSITVIDDWVHRFVLNNVKIMPQVAVCLYVPWEQHWVSKQNKIFIWPAATPLPVHLVEPHELGSSVFFGLVKWFEADVPRSFGCVCEGPRNGIQVVGPNCHQAPLPTKRKKKRKSKNIMVFSAVTFNNLYFYKQLLNYEGTVWTYD